MVFAAIAMLRNEADIFPAFAQHLAALFDIVLLLEHGSTDGTPAQIAAACEGRPGWMSWRVDVAGRYQSRFCAFALRHVFATTDADAVFFLEADEFIDVPDRSALTAMLSAPRPPRCLPMLHWRNAVPWPLTRGTVAIGDPILVAPEPSLFAKIVVPRDAFAATGGRLTPLAGNHVADPGDGLALPQIPIGSVLHLPLRSVAQMTRKTVIGALALRAVAARRAHEGVHQFDALARMARHDITPEDVLGWASAYGEPGAADQSRTASDLDEMGFTRRTLDVAHGSLGRDLPAGPAQTPVQAIAAALLAWRGQDDGAFSLTLEGDVLRAVPDAAQSDLLGNALAARDAALSEVAVLRASTSWRITAPLRAAIQALRGATPR